jgi:hypothetical protein
MRRPQGVYKRRSLRVVAALVLAAGWGLVASSPALALDTTSVSVTCGVSIGVGQEASCVATVTDETAAATPMGNVEFSTNGSGTFSAPSCPLVEVSGHKEQSSCEVRYTPTARGTGSHTITAKYPGDGTHAAAEKSTPLTVNTRATTTTLECGSGVVVSQAATCTATVTDTDTGTPSRFEGSVTFTPSSEGTFSPEAKCALSEVSGHPTEAGCSVTYTPTQTGSGPHTLVAHYAGGDEKHGASHGEDALPVTARSTSTSVTCPAVALGQATTCEATVTDTAIATRSLPQGEIEFSATGSGTFTPGTRKCEVVEVAGHSEQARCTVKYVPTGPGSGTQEVKAEYLGDVEHATSQGSTILTAGKRPTAVSVACGSGVLVSQPATCTVTVRDTGPEPASAPGGEVTLESNASGSFSPAMTCMLEPVAGPSGESVCLRSYTPSEVGSGTHTITAKYAGDSSHTAESGSIGLSVSAPSNPPPTKTGTTTTTTTTTPLGAPKCRLMVKEQWRSVGSKRHPRQTPLLLVPYTCDQNAAVKIEGLVSIKAGGHGRNRIKARTLKLLPGSSAAIAGQASPAVVLPMPEPVAKALGAGARTTATVTFTVRNSNGAGVATLRLTLVAPPKKHAHG